MGNDQPRGIDWKLDRELSISIGEQIRGKILYAISFGLLHPGEALPSVRELAQLLKVSPVTVSKVYKELTREGLLVAKPAVGVFVSELEYENGRSLLNTHSSLEQIIENSIRQAKFMGYSLDEIHETWHQVELRMRSSEVKKSLVLVGNYSSATRFYANQIESILSDLNLQVISLTFNDLLPKIDSYAEVLENAAVIVTLPQNIHDLRKVLEPHHYRVVTIAFELSPVTIQKLSAIRSDQRVGIVSTIPEFVQSMTNELAAYGLNIHPPKIALVNEADRIREMFKHVDVLVFASGAEQAIQGLPNDIIAFEFLHRPKLESVNRLRPLLS